MTQRVASMSRWCAVLGLTAAAMATVGCYGVEYDREPPKGEPCITCDPHATCDTSGTTPTCVCNAGYTGDGLACVAIHCPAQSIANGLVTPPDVGTPGSVIAYGCNSGYGLEGGDTTRTCQSNGSWSGTAPSCAPLRDGCASAPCAHGTCVPGANGAYSCTPCASGWTGVNCDLPVLCTGLVDPSNGAIDVTSAPVGGTATYACDVGYVLIGAATVTCQDDGAGNGVWSGTAPTCDPIDCAPLTSPANGSVTQPSTSLGSTALYACDAGFALGGIAMRTCQTDGTWSGVEPTCLTTGVCSGQCVHSATGCTELNPGYTCGTCDAGWSGPHCDVPVVCGGANAPQNGTVSAPSAMYDGRVTYQCDPGFLLWGTTTRICQADGSFGGVAPTCVPLTCNGAMAPTHGVVSATTASYGASVTYTCDVGYVIAGGAATRTCQQDGSFSGMEPTCAPQACAPVLVAPVNGSVSTTVGVTGDIATFSCDAGYVPSSSPTRTCQPDGTWSGTSPTCDFWYGGECSTNNPCVRGTCTDLGGGTVSCACDAGYVGPNCDVPIDCSGYATPANGSVSSTSTTFGMTVVYDCNAGYVLQGASMRTCQANGSLSGTAPTCAPITCLGANAPTNGWVSAPSVTFGNDVTYVCDLGYVLSGNGGLDTRTCLADGSLSGTEPSCVPAPCATDLAAPIHGSVSRTSGATGDLATYACDPGYALLGAATTTCQLDGTWSDPSPFCLMVVDPSCSPNPCVHSPGCTPVGPTGYACGPCDAGWTGTNCDTVIVCTGAPAPVNGAVSATSAAVGDSITYVCDAGYDLVGSATVACMQTGVTGSWSGPAPTCAPVTCSGATAPANGTVSVSSTTFGQAITYGCDPGYALSGNGGLNTRTCQANGAFGGTTPSCVPTACAPNLVPPVNGSVSQTSGVTGTMAVYSCDPGYVLNGNGGVDTRLCQPDGTWSGSAPTCDFNVGPCDVNPCVHGACTPIGTMVTCACIAGWTGTYCDQQVTCSGLTAPTNGTVDRTTGVTGDVASYACAPGYALVGSGTRTCQTNGAWTGSAPWCALSFDPLCFPSPCFNGGTCSTSGTTYVCACPQGYGGTNCETPAT